MNAPNSGSQLWPAKFKILTFWIRNHEPDPESIQNWFLMVNNSWSIFLISNRGTRGCAQWSPIRDCLQTWHTKLFKVVYKGENVRKGGIIVDQYAISFQWNHQSPLKVSIHFLLHELCYNTGQHCASILCCARYFLSSLFCYFSW